MDSGRFGRALGIGARLAGKALAEAADAAAAENPRAARKQEPQVIPPGERMRASTQGMRRGGRQFGEAVWRPVVRVSGVLWLEVTGVFFGIIALFGMQGVWTWRWAFAVGGKAVERRDFLLAVGVVVFFGYFCVSSFVRAGRRGRG